MNHAEFELRFGFFHHLNQSRIVPLIHLILSKFVVFLFSGVWSDFNQT